MGGREGGELEGKRKQWWGGDRKGEDGRQGEEMVGRLEDGG